MRTAKALMILTMLATTIGLVPIAAKTDQIPSPGARHEESSNEGCRFFKGSTCWGVMNGTLWAETVSFMDPAGKPAKFKKGQTLAQLNQNNNAYYGYKLMRVSFKLSRASRWHQPQLKVYVNSKARDREPVESDGGFWRGWEPEIFTVDVNDCPLDLWAVIGNGDVNAYSVTYYWEYPTTGWDSGGGYGPAPGPTSGPLSCGPIPPMMVGPNGEIGLRRTSEFLLRSLRGIQGTLDGQTYATVVEPILTTAYSFDAVLKANGAIDAAPQARDLITEYGKHAAELEKLSTVPLQARCVEAIRVAVLRIKNAYK